MNRIIITVLLLIISIYFIIKKDINSKLDDIQSTMKKYDINIDIKTKLKDNELDIEEFEKFAKAEYLANHQDTLRRLFLSIDKNKSNKVDYNEIKAYTLVSYYMNNILLLSVVIFIAITSIYIYYTEKHISKLGPCERFIALFYYAVLFSCIILAGLSILFLMSFAASIFGLITGSFNYGIPLFFIIYTIFLYILNNLAK